MWPPRFYLWEGRSERGGGSALGRGFYMWEGGSALGRGVLPREGVLPWGGATCAQMAAGCWPGLCTFTLTCAHVHVLVCLWVCTCTHMCVYVHVHKSLCSGCATCVTARGHTWVFGCVCACVGARARVCIQFCVRAGSGEHPCLHGSLRTGLGPPPERNRRHGCGRGSWGLPGEPVCARGVLPSQEEQTGLQYTALSRERAHSHPRLHGRVINISFPPKGRMKYRLISFLIKRTNEA